MIDGRNAVDQLSWTCYHTRGTIQDLWLQPKKADEFLNIKVYVSSNNTMWFTYISESK